MGVPCVQVDRTEGETTRQRLAEAGILDHQREIIQETGTLYLPVTDPEAVPAEYTVVERAVPERSQPTTPEDLLDFDPTYERIGEVIVIDEDDPDAANTLAEAIMDSDIPARAVLNSASKVTGEFRTREYELLAGEGTETVHREYGHEYAVDLAAVYFTPRLATERNRVSERVTADEQVLDMFAGVGPYAIPAAARGATVVAVDKNPVAIKYLKENAHRNDVADRITAINADVSTVTETYTDWADRLVMNLPHSADAFLETACALASGDCQLHYYDIQHESDPFGPGRAAITNAAAAAGYTMTVTNERVVRSYAPHELNVCIDARLQR